MNNLSKRITFENKLKTVEIDGIYVVSSDNVNEIKNVVNSLYNELDEENFNLKSVNKFVEIILPDTLEDVNYDLSIVINNIIFKSSSHSKLFLIFENGKFVQFNRDYITGDDKSKTILFGIPFNDELKDFDFSNNKIYYSLTKIENNLNGNFPFALGSIKETINFPETKFFVIQNSNDFESFKFAIENDCFDKIVDKVNYFYIEDPEKPYVDLSGVVYCNNEYNTIVSKRILIEEGDYLLGTDFEHTISGTFKNMIFSKTIKLVLYPSKEPSEIIPEGPDALKTTNTRENVLIQYNDGSYSEEIANVKCEPIYNIDNGKILYTLKTYEYKNISKKVIIKSNNKFPTKLNVTLDKYELSPFSNTITCTASIVYSDGSIEDIIPNFKEVTDNVIDSKGLRFLDNDKEYNKLGCYPFNQSDGGLVIYTKNEIKYDVLKAIIFSIKIDDTILYDIKNVNLINSPGIFLGGTLLTSNGNSLIRTTIQSSFMDFDDIKLNEINNQNTIEALKQNRMVEPITIEKINTSDTTEVNFIDFIENSNENLYYECEVYADNGLDGMILIRSYKLPNKMEMSKNRRYVLNFSNVSSKDESKYIKDEPLEINKAFAHNYVLGFKNLKLEVSEKTSLTKTYTEILDVKATFLDKLNNEHHIEFIYDKINDLWLTSVMPIKLVKLKNIDVSFAYITDTADFII